MEPIEGATGGTASITDAVNAAFPDTGSTAPASTPAPVESSPQSPASPPSAQGENTTPPPAPTPEAMRLAAEDMAKMVEIEVAGGVTKLMPVAEVAKGLRGARQASYETHMANVRLQEQLAAYEAEIAELRAAQQAAPPYRAPVAPQDDLYNPYEQPDPNAAPLDPAAYEKIAEAVATRVLTQAQQEAYARQQEMLHQQAVEGFNAVVQNGIAADPVLSKMNNGRKEDTWRIAVTRAREIFQTPGALSIEEYNAFYTDPTPLVRQVLSSMKNEHLAAEAEAKRTWLADTQKQIKDAGAPRVGGTGSLAPIPQSPSSSSRPKTDAELREEISRQYDAVVEAMGRG